MGAVSFLNGLFRRLRSLLDDVKHQIESGSVLSPDGPSSLGCLVRGSQSEGSAHLPPPRQEGLSIPVDQRKSDGTIADDPVTESRSSRHLEV
jgi:hypothetical protein